MDINFNNGKIFCTKCGAPNKAGYRFCVKCGAKLVTSVPKPQVEDEPGILKVESVKVEPEPEMPTFSTFEQTAPAEESMKAEPEPEMPTFSVFEQTAPATEPAKPEPEMPTFSAFEQEAPAEESMKAEPEPEMPTFSVFEQAAPAAEPEPEMPTFSAFEQEAPAAEPEPEMPTFSVFEQEAPKEEPVQTAGFSGNGQAAFEAEPKNEYTGFARSGFAGATTPTAAAGAFATAVEAVKNNKQIDVSDAETVMSLLEQGESSALAKGLPAWDIVPPQVVVRRKHRV